VPTNVIAGRRSLVVLFAVFAMVIALLALPVAPANAAATAACPATTPSAGFTDIGGLSADAVDSINCIAFYNITKGTSATTYSPAANVARWQMALFLTRQAKAHGVTLPSGADQGFTDLAGLSAEATTAVNQLKQLAITTGTTATTYDPFGSVSRWQMALFITRLVTAAGITLPSGADQGFTDLAGLSAAAVTAVNQLKQLAISTGTSATTFDPFANVSRWQMALFLARTLQAGGVVPPGTGSIVTAVAAPDVSYADTAAGKVVKVTTKVTDKFSVDGTPASQGAFLAAASIGDLLNVVAGTPPTYQLTNKVAADYKAGVIDDVGATSFDIVEPISGVVLRNDFATNGVYQLFSTDGASVSVAAFNLDANAGDTVTITGKGTVADIQTVALTNQTVTGAAKGVAGASPNKTFNVGVFADAFFASAGDALTVDGAAATETEFDDDLSNGDSVTYSMKGGKATIALTNAASAAISGKVLNNDESVANTVDIDGAVADAAYDNAGTVYIVNGALDDMAGLEAALTAGDDISIVRADGVVNTVDRVTLTDAAFSGTPETRGVGTITVTFEAAGDESEAIDYTSLTPDVGLVGTGVVKYTVNANAAATVGAFAAALDSIIGGAFNGTVSVAKVGVDIVWTVTTTS